MSIPITPNISTRSTVPDKKGTGNSRSRRRIHALVVAVVATTTTSSQSIAAVGSWAVLNSNPSGVCAPVALLTDGRVLCQGEASSTDLNWYTLTPDPTGSYQNGTWSSVSTSHNHYAAGPSTLLKDGRFWIGGGEYSSDPAGMEIYDPVANTWTKGPEYPYLNAQGQPFGISDGAATVLADGRVFCSSYEGQPGPTWQRIAYVYDPSANTWSETFHGTPGPVTHEQGFNLLPDQRVFTISGIDGSPAFLYSPSSDTWAQGASPAQALTYAAFNEIGPQVVLYSGKVMVLGTYIPNDVANHNNIYDPSSGTWANNVPDWPTDFHTYNGFGDTTAAVMPNGNVLAETWSPAAGATAFFEYDPVANAFSTAPAMPAGESSSDSPAEIVLPNGQILVDAVPNKLLYTPSGSPNSAWLPIIDTVTLTSGSTYTVTGKQLNGLTNGAFEGDDGTYTSSYPLVRISNGAGVYYVRTFNFSTMAPSVAGTSAESQFQFTLPPNFPHGVMSLYVVASGVSSRPKRITF
jgi:hypothetical protein